MAASQPREKITAWQWAEKHVEVDKTSPMPGMWRSDNSPWCRLPMEWAADSSVEQIAMMWPAQCSKTQTLICLIAWIVDQDPGPLMWVMAAQDEAKTFARTRLMPTLEMCPPAASHFPKKRHDKATLEINFDSMPMIINGANSQSKLQSKPIRWLFLDEVRNYPPGALEMVKKRTTRFWNSKTFIISTPDLASSEDVSDPVHDAFLEGSQHTWFFDCPKCGQAQRPKWEQMKWDENIHTRPDGKWNFNEVAKTVRYECISCGHGILDRPDQRRRMCDEGKWIDMNPNAPHNKKSCHVSGIVPFWTSWSRLVEEFLRAVEAARKGAIEPLKSFVNERLGEPWDQRNEFVQVDRPPEDAYSWEEVDPASFDAIFQMVDVQQNGLWCGVRGWNKDGSSKLLFYDRLLTFGDVDELQERFKIPNVCVGVDSGYNTHKVYEECAARPGWVALKGEDKPYFLHTHKGRRTRRIYSPIQYVDPRIGKPGGGMARVPFILWSNPAAKDILKRLRDGLGAPHEIPRESPKQYLKQMASEAKRPFPNKKTGRDEWVWVTLNRNNHAWDIEAMQVVFAAVAGFLGEVEIAVEDGR